MFDTFVWYISKYAHMKKIATNDFKVPKPRQKLPKTCGLTRTSSFNSSISLITNDSNQKDYDKKVSNDF